MKNSYLHLILGVYNKSCEQVILPQNKIVGVIVMAKERMIEITVVISEEEIKQLFEAREIKYKKQYFNEIEEAVCDDYSVVEGALGELVDEIIADNYEEDED